MEPIFTAENFSQNAKTFLAKVREKVQTPETWTQGAYARNKNEKKVPFGEKDCKYCLLGAIYLTQRGLMDELGITRFHAENYFTRHLLQKLTGFEEHPYTRAMNINDSFKNHDHFLSWFDNRVEEITV